MGWTLMLHQEECLMMGCKANRIASAFKIARCWGLPTFDTTYLYSKPSLDERLLEQPFETLNP